MQPQSPYPGQPGGDRANARFVAAPKEYEGVGNALRSAYLPRISDMPCDIADLLDRLS